MSLTKWFKYLFLILLGCSLPFIAYKISEGYKEDAYVQQHSPRVKMPVVHRQKGWGTVRLPNKIYVHYQGKNYALPCSNRYFRETTQLDSLSVHYDRLRDRAVLADVKISAPYGLLVLIVLAGLITVIGTIVELRRQLIRIDT